MKTKEINEHLVMQQQSWFYRWVGKLDNKSVKVCIKRNAYDTQSYIEGYIMKNKEEWSKIVWRPINDSAVKTVSYVQKDPDKNLFIEEKDSVLKEIYELIK